MNLKRLNPKNLYLVDRYSAAKKSKRYTSAVTFIQKKPFTAFFATLGLFLLILMLSSVISNLGKKEVKAQAPTKDVSVYGIGEAPSTTLQAQVESNGIIQIVAQMPGIVQSVNVTEGQSVSKGQSLVQLSSNYQGGNAPGLQAQLAGAQYRNAKETFNLSNDLISKQRSVATASAENTEQLRRISDQSLGETRDLLSLNESLLEGLNDAIEAIEQSPNPDQQELAALRGQKAGLQAGVNQLKSGLRATEYSTSTSNPPTTISNLTKDITLKQLDLQEKALRLGKEVSKIQYNLSLVQAGMMNPASPFAGTVQRINVQVGQEVNPGDVIATISSNSLNSTAILRAPREIARSISMLEPSVFTIEGKKVSVTPTYVSTVATDGQLYSIVYSLPDGVTENLTDQQYIPVQVPAKYANTNSVIPFVPIDTVYESQNESTVYVAENGKAVARKVQVGSLYGEYVQINSGLKNGDSVILDRNVVNGDKVKIIKN